MSVQAPSLKGEAPLFRGGRRSPGGDPDPSSPLLSLASDGAFRGLSERLPGPVEAPWDWFCLLVGDVREVELPEAFASAIYLDPFSPRVNPEAWGLEVLKKLRRAALPGARLVTYSAAGWVRRNLKAAGFRVEGLPSPWKRA